MSETRLRLGDTLVEAGVITEEQLHRALEIQKERQLRLGTILLQEGFVAESQLVQALSLKLSIPWVSLWRIDIEDEMLDMVPANVAEEFFLIPIYIRTTADGERALYVAMNDPMDEDALRFVAASAGMPVKPMIAGPSDIAAAIRFYYYGEEEEEQPPAAPAGSPVAPPPPPPGAHSPSAPPPPPPGSLSPSKPPLPPTPVPEEAEPEELDDEDLELEPEDSISEVDDHAGAQSAKADDVSASASADAEATGGSSTSEDDDRAEAQSAEADEDEAKVFADKTAAQREAERRLFGVGGSKPAGGFSLTLLDGTTLAFGPGKKQKPASTKPDQLTVEDLLAGLKAAAEGTPLDDFLPKDKWEDYVRALLAVLFRKHLVFFEEFMKELEGGDK